MPTKADDIVVFQLPDGTEVSNDPRWHTQKMYEQMEAAVMENSPHTGVATPSTSQMQQHVLAPPQSGQPGVGPAAVGVGDRADSGASLQPGEDGYVHPEQGRAAAHTDNAGAVSPFESDDDEDLDDESEDKPYDEWSGKELTAEVKARRKLGRDIDLSGGKKKPDVIAALEADDEAAAAETP